MTWRGAVADWKDVDRRRPIAWWLGLSGTLLGTAAWVVLEGRRIAPRGPARWILLAALLLALVAVGRRVFWNDAERRLRLPWRIAGYVVVVGLLNAAARATGLRLSADELERGSGAALRLTGTALVMFTLASIVAVRVFDRRPVRELGIVPGPRFWGDLGFGLALGAFLMTAIFAIENAAGWIRIEAVAYTRAAGEAFGGAFLRMAGVFACVGFYEELTSRGYLLRTMAQGFTGRRVPSPLALAIAVVLSSLLFGLGHADNPAAVRAHRTARHLHRVPRLVELLPVDGLRVPDQRVHHPGIGAAHRARWARAMDGGRVRARGGAARPHRAGACGGRHPVARAPAKREALGLHRARGGGSPGPYRSDARISFRISGRTGFVRWWVKPASRVRRRSSSWP